MATTEPITAQDLTALGKDAPYELIMGELVEVSLAPANASIIAVNITCALDSFVRPRTLGQGDMLDGEDVLPGFRLPVADIFDSIG